MEWEHKGMRFSISSQPLGSLFMASARVPREGPFIRVRPFSAVGRSQEEALTLLKEQIELEFRSAPDLPGD